MLIWAKSEAPPQVIAYHHISPHRESDASGYEHTDQVM